MRRSRGQTSGWKNNYSSFVHLNGDMNSYPRCADCKAVRWNGIHRCGAIVCFGHCGSYLTTETQFNDLSKSYCNGCLKVRNACLKVLLLAKREGESLSYLDYSLRVDLLLKKKKDDNLR